MIRGHQKLSRHSRLSPELLEELARVYWYDGRHKEAQAIQMRADAAKVLRLIGAWL